MNKYFISFLIACVSLLYSCNKQQEKILISAAHLMDNAPDSAHTILETIDVTRLSESQYYYFVTLKVRAKDKLYLNAVEDTVVFQATNYFLKKKDAEYIPYACFVSARVEEEQNNPEKAMEYYFEAVKWIDKANNFLLNGDIHYNLSRLLYHTNQYESSLFYLAQGEKYYDLANCSYEKKIYVNELIALNYRFLNELEKSLSFFRLAENIAIQEKDLFNEQRIVLNTALVYRDAKQFQLAKEKCNQALCLTEKNDSTYNGKLQLMLGVVFLEEGKIDSATTCLQQAESLLENSNDLTDLIDLNNSLSKVATINKNYERSSYYQALSKAYTKTREKTEAAAQAIIKRHQDHTFQIYEAERIKHVNERRWHYAIITILSLVILLGAVFYRNKSNVRKFKGIFRTNKENMERKDEEYNRKVEEYNKEIETYEQKIDQSEEAKAQMEDRLSIVQKISVNQMLKVLLQIKDLARLRELTDARQIDYKEVNRQVSKTLQKVSWTDAKQIYDLRYNNLFDRLRNDQPGLSEVDYRICALSFVGLGASVIAVILSGPDATNTTHDLALNTILGKRKMLRKQLGIDRYGNFQSYVYETYGIEISDKDDD